MGRATCARSTFATALLVGLGACGGGGGGGAPSSPPPPPPPPPLNYTGSTAQAAIAPSAASGGRIADAVIAAAGVTIALGAGADPQPPVDAGSGSTTRPCSVSGTVTTALDYAVDGTGKTTTTFDKCNDGSGYTTDGISVFTAVSAIGATHAEAMLTLTSLTITSATATEEYAGSVEYLDTSTQGIGAPQTHSLTASLVIADSASKRQLKLENVVIATQAPTPTGSMTISGRVYDSSLGYVDVTSDAPLDLVGANDGLWSGGPLRVQGSGPTLWLTPVTHGLTALALDPSASDHPSEAVTLTTSQSFEGQLDAPTTTPATAAAGPNRTVAAGAPITLNGYFSGAGTHRWVSSFAWKILMQTPGSSAVLSDSAAPAPSFTPDQPGQYLISLTTTDGANSSRDSVLITVPLPNGFVTPDDPSRSVYIGPDSSVALNTQVTLSAAFSTWLPPAASIDCTIVVTDPTGHSSMPVTGDSSLSTTFSASLTGFYTASLESGAPPMSASSTRVIAAGMPLRYLQPTALVVPAGGQFYAFADLNGDGKLDFVATGLQSGPTGTAAVVQLLLGTGPGAFALPTYLFAGDGGPIVVGDFNGDGRPDLAVETNHGVDILLQNADGTWQAPRSVPLPNPSCTIGSTNRALIAADFNHDGRLDLAFADPCGGGTDVAFQQAGGSFVSVQLAGVPSTPTSLAAGDLNGDAYLDLAIGVRSPDSGTPATVLVYPGTAAAAFGSATTIALPNSTNNPSVALTIGDFDGDGHPDLLAASFAGVFWMRQSAGVLAAPVALAPGGSVAAPNVQVDALVLHDVDGDGRMDVVTSTYGTGVPAVLIQQPNGSVSAPMPLFQGPGVAQPLRFVDVTGDGVPDIVYTGSAIALQAPALIVIPARSP